MLREGPRCGEEGEDTGWSVWELFCQWLTNACQQNSFSIGDRIRVKNYSDVFGESLKTKRTLSNWKKIYMSKTLIYLFFLLRECSRGVVKSTFTSPSTYMNNKYYLKTNERQKKERYYFYRVFQKTLTALQRIPSLSWLRCGRKQNARFSWRVPMRLCIDERAPNIFTDASFPLT